MFRVEEFPFSLYRFFNGFVEALGVLRIFLSGLGYSYGYTRCGIVVPSEVFLNQFVGIGSCLTDTASILLLHVTKSGLLLFQSNSLAEFRVDEFAGLC